MSIVSYEPKVSDFLNLSKKEEILPKALTRLKTVSISTKDIISVKESETLCDIDLLINVPLDKYRYVGILGAVFTGEWLVPDFVKGGVTISVIDKRLVNSKECVIGTYRAAAKSKRFQFKLVPNYFVSTMDAKRKPWQVHVRIQDLKIEAGWQPLALEVVSVAMVTNNVVMKGLREKVVAINDPDVEGFEGVVDEFVDSVAAFKAVDNFRKRKKKVEEKGVVSKYKYRPEKYAGPDSFNLKEENVLQHYKPESVPVFRSGVGRAHSDA
uniref:Movement protein n=1 Tax=Turnip vein-clearing virus TaxID=29272 RepID=A0A5B8YY79_TVCV|nr:TVCVgp3 [Turnip vein-clearing virus]